MFLTILLVTFFLVGPASVSAIAADDQSAVSADQLEVGAGTASVPKGGDTICRSRRAQSDGGRTVRIPTSRLQPAIRCRRTCIPVMRASPVISGDVYIGNGRHPR